MTTRNDARNDRRTLTEFISGFGIEYRWLYADESGAPPVDPDTDWAVFSARDYFMAWEMYCCLTHHIATIRNSVWLNDDDDIIVPLGIAEITAATAALENFRRDFDHRTNGIRINEDKYAPTGRIARAIYRETIQEFLWRWEGTDADFREPSRPTQWTHEFPLALVELLETLERETALLARISGTTRTDSPRRESLAGLSLQEHMTKHGLDLRWLEYPSPIASRLRPQDCYTAAYLVWALERIEEPDSEGLPSAEECMAYILAASEAVYAALDAEMATWDIRSRMSNILSAFHHAVTVPTLRAAGTSVAVYLVVDATRGRSRKSDAPANFIREVVVPTLRYLTQDQPDQGEVSAHYQRFASKLHALHALARELAGDDMRLLCGEADEREDFK